MTFIAPKKMFAGVVGLFCGLLTAAPCHAQSTWNKASSGSWDWSDTGNWLDGSVPGNPEAGPVEIRVPANSFTILLDTPGDQVLENGVAFKVGTTNFGQVTFDLQGKRLILDGGELALLISSGGSARTAVAFHNGTVQLGTAEHSASVALNGPDTSINSGMVFGAGSIFNTTNTSSILIASNSYNRLTGYTLDLSQATFQSGTTPDALVVTDSIAVGQGLSTSPTSDRNKLGILKLGKASTLEIGQNLILGQNINSSGNSISVSGSLELDAATEGPVALNIGHDLRIGVGDRVTGAISGSPLELNVQVGSAQTPIENRGVLYVGYKNRTQKEDNSATGSFLAAGGSFEAYVRELRIGENNSTGGSAEGILDFGNSALQRLEVSGDATIGKGVNAVGSLSLKGGSASSETLTVGESTSVSRSLLSLDQTTWSVSESLLVGALGTIEIIVVEGSAGLDLLSDEPLNLVIQPGGVIHVTFAAAPDTQNLWGLRLLGDYQGLLGGYLESHSLTASGAYGGSAQVFFDGTYTYYGIAAIPEPGAVVLFGFAGLLLTALYRRRTE